MTRPRKILLAGCATVLGLCLVAVAAGVAVLRSDWFREQARARIVREVETATGGRAEIGSFHFDWTRMTAGVSGFTLHGTEPAADPPLFRASSIEVGLKIVSALRRDIDIQSLTVREPHVRVVVSADGATNLPKPKVARPSRRPLEPFLAAAIDRFAVEQGVLEINDRRIPIGLRGERLSSRLVYETAGPRYTGDVSFRRLHVTGPDWLPAAMDADIALSLEADRLEIREARLATDASNARLDGEVRHLLNPEVVLSIESRLSLREMLRLAKAPPAVRGQAGLSGEFRYSGAAGYSLDATVSGSQLTAEADGMKLPHFDVTSRVKAVPGALELSGLQIAALDGQLSGSVRLEASRRLHVAAEVRGIRVSDVAAMRGLPVPPFDGLVSGPVALSAGVAAGRLQDADITGSLAVERAVSPRPLSGLLNVSFNQRQRTLQFANSRLATPASNIEFNGTLGDHLRLSFRTRDLEDLLPLGAYLGESFPRVLPIALRDGDARFQGEIAGSLEAPRLAGRAEVSNLVYEGHLLDRVEADIALDRTAISAGKVLVEMGGARLEGQGRASLDAWKPSGATRLAGSFSIRGLTLERLAAEARRSLPLRGLVNGTIQVGGTMAEPQATARLSVADGEALGRRIRAVRLQGRYADRSLTVESFDVDTGAGSLSGSALYTHQPKMPQAGTLRFDIAGKGVSLALLRPEVALPETVEGVVDGQFRGAASIERGAPLLTELHGQAAVTKLAWKGEPAGEVRATASSENGILSADLEGQLFGVRWKAASSIGLRGDYPVGGELSFSRVTLASLEPWLKLAGVSAPPLEASTDGTIYLSGLLRQPEGLRVRIELPGVEVLPPLIKGAVAPRLRNSGLVVLSATRKAVRVVSAYFAGPDTNLQVTGGVDLGTRFNAYDLRVRGSVDLNILHSFDANLVASGDSTVDANIRGRLGKPELYGRLEFRRASLNLAEVPNGVENASGVVLFYRDRATIESLTAETGGGKVSVKGYIGLGGPQWSYRLQAAASKVRLRYPEGHSTSMDRVIELTGTSERSLLSGTVTVLRSGVSPGVDLASLVSRASQSMVTPAATNELLRGMQFDVRVVTAPDARFDTMITRDIQAEAEMRLRGTPYKPVLLGRVTISRGEVIFLGNAYTVSRGEISFLNPVRLEPVLKVDLETRVRGIDVTMSLTGPADRLNLGFRSEPPLQYQEILALLAVGRAPTSDPTLLARQTQQDQSWQQAGASTLVGQALAAPVAGRLQRFFGVSRIKIDPKLTGLGNNPEAQITLEQQVSKDITFTYVTNLAQEQQQLIRVEWNVSRQWSILAVREENGLFGVEFQFRKQFR